MNLVFRFVYLWLTAAILIGCVATAPVKIDEFTAYRDAFEVLGEGSESALAFERDWAYRNYLSSFAEGGVANPADVILEFPDGPGAPFLWTLPDAPVYMAIHDTETRLAEVNKLFSGYTSMLVELAGGSKDDTARIKALGESLNSNSLGAAKALGIDTDSKNVAFFSAAATTAAEAYLNNKRRKSLRTVLRENQPAVDAFARLGADAASLSAVGIKSEYQDDTGRWTERVIAAAPAKRSGLIEEQLALNDRVIAQLDALRRIHDGYLMLAKKHAELATSVTTGHRIDLQRLIEDGKRLRDFYQDLKNAEKSAGDQGGKK